MKRKSNTLAARMKGYEAVYKNVLPIRTPTLIRCDGRAFRNFTKGFKRPFSKLFRHCMIEAAKHMCRNIPNTEIAYTQSDEITLLLVEKGENTESWYSKRLNKLLSVSASICTNGFNKALYNAITNKSYINPFTDQTTKLDDSILNHIYTKVFQAEFDCTAFSLPEFEVNNAFIFRQRDAVRNAIHQVAHCYFSTKELEGVNSGEVIEKLKNERNFNWNEVPIYFQRGVCVFKENFTIEDKPDVVRTRWNVDLNIPIFEEDRNYINKHLIYQGDLKQIDWKKKDKVEA